MRFFSVILNYYILTEYYKSDIQKIGELYKLFHIKSKITLNESLAFNLYCFEYIKQIICS